MNLRAVRKFNKEILYTNMDSMSCDMDCLDNVHDAMHALIKAVKDMNKSMEYKRNINSKIEANLRDTRRQNKKAPLLQRSA